MCHLYGSNMYCRDHKSVIRTDYIHNTHCEKYLSLTRHNILSIFTLDIYIILWYTKIVIDSMHAFLLGGVGRLAYVRRDPPVHVC